MIRRNLLFIEVFILVVIALGLLLYITYDEGKVATEKLVEVKQKKQDSTIARYAHTIDSLTKYNDSISQQLDAYIEWNDTVKKIDLTFDQTYNQNK